MRALASEDAGPALEQITRSVNTYLVSDSLVFIDQGAPGLGGWRTDHRRFLGPKTDVAFTAIHGLDASSTDITQDGLCGIKIIVPEFPLLRCAAEKAPGCWFQR